jgi:hypothetical protein
MMLAWVEVMALGLRALTEGVATGRTALAR